MSFKAGYHMQHDLSYSAYPDQLFPPRYPYKYDMVQSHSHERHDQTYTVSHERKLRSPPHSKYEGNFAIDDFIGKLEGKKRMRRSRSSSSERKLGCRSRSPIRHRGYRNNRGNDDRRKDEQQSRSPPRRDNRYKLDDGRTRKSSTKEEYRHRSSHRKKSYPSDTSEEDGKSKHQEHQNAVMRGGKNYVRRKTSTLREQNRKRSLDAEESKIKKSRYEDILSDDDMSSSDTVKSDGNNNREVNSIERTVTKPDEEKGILAISVTQKGTRNLENDGNDQAKENIALRKEDKKKKERHSSDGASKANIEEKAMQNLSVDERKKELDKIFSGHGLKVFPKRFDEKKLSSDTKLLNGKPHDQEFLNESKSKVEKGVSSTEIIDDQPLEGVSKARFDSAVKATADISEMPKTPVETVKSLCERKNRTQSLDTVQEGHSELKVKSLPKIPDSENSSKVHEVIKAYTPEKVEQLNKTLSEMENKFNFASVLKRFCFNNAEMNRSKDTPDNPESRPPLTPTSSDKIEPLIQNNNKSPPSHHSSIHLYSREPKQNQGCDTDVNAVQMYTAEEDIEIKVPTSKCDKPVPRARDDIVIQKVDCVLSDMNNEGGNERKHKTSVHHNHISPDKEKTQIEKNEKLKDQNKKVDHKVQATKSKEAHPKEVYLKVKSHRNIIDDSKSVNKDHNKNCHAKNVEKIRQRRHTGPSPTPVTNVSEQTKVDNSKPVGQIEIVKHTNDKKEYSSSQSKSSENSLPRANKVIEGTKKRPCFNEFIKLGQKGEKNHSSPCAAEKTVKRPAAETMKPVVLKQKNTEDTLNVETIDKGTKSETPRYASNNKNPLFNKNKRRESHYKEKPLTAEFASNLKDKSERVISKTQPQKNSILGKIKSAHLKSHKQSAETVSIENAKLCKTVTNEVIQVSKRTEKDTPKSENTDPKEHVNKIESAETISNNTKKPEIHPDLPQQTPSCRKTLFKSTSVNTSEKLAPERKNHNSGERYTETEHTENAASSVKDKATTCFEGKEIDKSEEKITDCLNSEANMGSCDPEIYHKGVQSVMIAEEDNDLDDIEILKDIGQGNPDYLNSSGQESDDVEMKSGAENVADENCPTIDIGEHRHVKINNNHTDFKQASSPVIAMRNENGSLNINVPDEQLKECAKISYYDDVLIYNKISNKSQPIKRKQFAPMLSNLSFGAVDGTDTNKTTKEKRKRKKVRQLLKNICDSSCSDTDEELLDFKVNKSKDNGSLDVNNRHIDKAEASSWLQKARQNRLLKPSEKLQVRGDVIQPVRVGKPDHGTASETEDESMPKLLDSTEMAHLAPLIFEKGLDLQHLKVLDDGSMVTTRAHLDPKKLYGNSKSGINLGKCLRCLSCSMFFTPLQFTVHVDDVATMNRLDRDKCALIDFMRDGPSDEEERLVFKTFQGFFHAQKTRSTPNFAISDSKSLSGLENVEAMQKDVREVVQTPSLQSHLQAKTVERATFTPREKLSVSVEQIPSTTSVDVLGNVSWKPPLSEGGMQTSTPDLSTQNQIFRAYKVQPVLNSLTVKLVSPLATPCAQPSMSGFDCFSAAVDDIDPVNEAACNLSTLSTLYTSPTQTSTSGSAPFYGDNSSDTTVYPLIKAHSPQLTNVPQLLKDTLSEELSRLDKPEIVTIVQTQEIPEAKPEQTEDVASVGLKVDSSTIVPLWVTGVDDKPLTDSDKSALSDLIKQAGQLLGINCKDENILRFTVGSLFLGESGRVWATKEQISKKKK